ncbi:PREDICTED: xylogen-like protein 11 isoform X2 [Lupinus angustifolius]|uniref:xylogen-like protein 11 isoform X2 n=1 Tax=Lupinus angustifolius TaxID=3871 RepID=UPI00092EACD3|nr:PREDICTED: xylogen-like protein 11 isoform X2 [Lupinus angustifolius]
MATTTTTNSTCKMAYIVALVLALAWYGASGQSPAPETATAPSPTTGSSGCFTALLNMSDCLSYVEDGSNLSKPEKGCCPELAGLVDSNPICLCELLGNPDSIGIKINLNKAIKLPSICAVTTPPVSTCSELGIPVSSPAPEDSTSPTPSNLDSEGPSTSPIPSSDEAAAATPSQNNHNGASPFHASILTFIFLSISIFF